MQSADGLRRVAKEFVEDLAADGVIYGEVRWAPEQHLARGLSLEEAVEAVQEGIEEGESNPTAPRPRYATASSAISSERSVWRIAVMSWPTRMSRLDYLATHFFPVTVHAGEAAGLDSIRSALIDGRALRLGKCVAR
jgi:adenosine deaminase